ncbi:MAG: DUF2834 domain-containing protein [Sulfitobacter sp.]
MSLLRKTYLALAIWGAVQPLYFIALWLGEHGFDLAALFAAWQVNAASSALMWDLLIAAAALSVWIIAEVSVRRNWRALIAIPATFCIGVSCGLPLYLFLRTAPIK